MVTLNVVCKPGDEFYCVIPDMSPLKIRKCKVGSIEIYEHGRVIYHCISDEMIMGGINLDTDLF